MNIDNVSYTIHNHKYVVSSSRRFHLLLIFHLMITRYILNAELIIAKLYIVEFCSHIIS